MKGDAYNKLEIEKSIYQKINDEKKELEESSSDKKKKKKEGRQNNGGKDSFKSILARFFDEDEN
jgi:hypothetical protein